MTRSNTLPLLFRGSYILIGIVGILASLGLFDGAFRDDFYLPFTHLSNYACIGIMLIRSITTIRAPQTRGRVNPLLSFIGLTAILLTFTVFHLVLAPAPGRDPSLNYRPASILLHVVLPLMYTLDWLIFSEHGRLPWYAPLAAVASPLVYAIFVFTRAAIFSFDSTRATLYPYFFLDLDRRSPLTVAGFMGLILIGYLILGYLILAADRLLSIRQKHHRS